LTQVDGKTEGKRRNERGRTERTGEREGGAKEQRREEKGFILRGEKHAGNAN